MSMPFLTSPFYTVQVDLTKKASAAAGLRFLQATDANQDPSKQVTDVHTLVDLGASGLLITPRDSDAIAPALAYTASKKVPVVMVDQGATSGQVAMTVRADNVAMGVRACEEIGTSLGGKGKVLELQGDFLSVNGRQRSKGFQDCMKQRFPSILITSQPTKWQADEAAKITDTVLTSQSDLGAIYMASDATMYSAVASTLQRRGHWAKVGDPNHIMIVGVDGSPEILQGLREGYADAAISQPLDKYAEYGVDYLKRAIAGETFQPGPTNHGTEVKIADGMLIDYIEAPLVTKDNVDDASLWGNVVGR